MAYVSAQQDLYRYIITELYNSPLNDKLDGHIYDRVASTIGYDENNNKIKPFSYLIVGESSSTHDYASNGHTEHIAVTYHIYHRDDTSFTVDNARELLGHLAFLVEFNNIDLEHYRLVKSRIDNQQVITDVDFETMHCILRVNYEIKHKIRSGK